MSTTTDDPKPIIATSPSPVVANSDPAKIVPASDVPAKASSVSKETQALVEKRMSGESDEIKQKMGELIDAIKQRAETELESTEEMTQEAYVKVIEEAKATLKKTEVFFQEQEQSLEQSLQKLTGDATEGWETFWTELQSVGDRVERAVDAAWQILTEPDDSTPPDAKV